MLIEFSVSNYRSVHERQTLTMMAGAGKELRRENTFDSKTGRFGRIVRTSVIYGANAAGKTNLLRALQFLQSLVVNSSNSAQQGFAISGYVPFRFAPSERDAGEFRVVFVHAKIAYEYVVVVDSTRVVEEQLIAYPLGRPQRLFSRVLANKGKSYRWTFSANLRGNRAVWRDATRPNALFLSTAVQLNSSQLAPVFEWFQKRLVVVAGPTQFNTGLTIKLLASIEGKERLLPFLRAADLGISDLSMTREPLVAGVPLIGAPIVEQMSPGSPPNLVRVTSYHDVGKSKKAKVGLDIGEESSGTQLLFKRAGAWLNVFDNGEVLLVDEIDTSLHPLLTRYLIALFHSEKDNKKNAQLICTTHDTSLLDPRLFRRDQIWFAEKSRNGSTTLAALSDFKVRKDESYERGYLRGRYGALPIIGKRPVK